MLQRVDADPLSGSLYAPVQPAGYIYPILPEDELETPPLPREHPPWVKDALSVSQRTRALLARIKPVIVRVLGFWDHTVRSITIGTRRVTIDTSGSYKLE
ncbi:MAG: hypothetical protein M3R35_05845 [Candidatus Eremiobacteraeota bacterium]|nr:hypothetical protein [Candidatus Eremiobacteraeota bacterium]